MAGRFTCALLGSLWTMVSCARDPAGQASSAGAISSQSAAINASTPSATRPTVSAIPMFSASANVQRLCSRICAISTQLKCPNSNECLRNCLGMGSMTPCTEPMVHFFECLTGQSSDRWECGDDGVASVHPGYCEHEQEATIACMRANMQQP